MFAALCLALSLPFSVQALPGQLFGGGRVSSTDIETVYREVKGEKLGAYLASKFADKKALILLPAEEPTMPGEEVAVPGYAAVVRCARA
jgi:hypothetical protein